MRDATIEIISEVKPHGNADRLDLVKILGFQCVSQRGLYKGGEKIVYIRPDSLLPAKEWAEEYRKYSPKRVKAVKLRNEWSEGIIVPFELLKHVNLENVEVGQDVSELLEVVHYEPPAPQDLQAKGYLPYNIGKTDEERFENMVDTLPYGESVDLSLKVDGQSNSFYYHLEDDTFGVLGRTLEMKAECSNKYTDQVNRYDIKNKLEAFCKKEGVSLCIRGESYGSGVQSMENNPHSKLSPAWAMFSVYNITERKYENKGSKYYYINLAKELNLPTVDMVEENVILTKEIIEKYSIGINRINDKPFEGIVVKHSNGSFKIINKDYDSKK